MKKVLPFMNPTHTIRAVILLFLALGLSCPCAYAQAGVPFNAQRAKAVAYRNKGMLLQNEGNLERALKLFRSSQQEDPSYAEVYNDLGVLYEAQGLNEQAEKEYLKAVERDPCFASAYSNLALFYEGRRDLQKARFYWQKRVEVGNPEDPWTQKAKEKLIALGEGPVSVAEPPAQEGLSLMQQQARAYREEGLRLQKLGDIDGALTRYLKAREIDPYYAAIHNDIGVIYETKGLPVVAEGHYLQAIRIDPAFPSAYTNLAILSENKRDLKKAREYWEKRRQLSPGDEWSQTAEARLRDIALVTDFDGARGADEQDVLDLVDAVSLQKSVNDATKSDAQKRAARSFAKAQESLRRGNEMDAYKNAIDAYQNDPQNQEIQRFLFRIQKDMLSR